MEASACNFKMDVAYEKSYGILYMSVTWKGKTLALKAFQAPDYQLLHLFWCFAQRFITNSSTTPVLQVLKGPIKG